MEKVHLVTLLICKQQVHYYYYSYLIFRCACSRKVYSGFTEKLLNTNNIIYIDNV